MSWQTALKNLSIKHFMSFDRTGAILESGISDFKAQYPGIYIIEEYYNSNTMKFDLRLKFENEQDELLWKIKWS